MRKFGVLLNDLSASQLSYYFIRNTNRLLAERADIDVIAFVDHMVKPCLNPSFAVMHMAEAYAYDAVMVATNLGTAFKLLTFPCSIRKHFYVWDLEWCRRPSMYDSFASIYRNPELSLWARGTSHSQLIENAWNRPAEKLVDDFKWSDILA